MQFQFSAEINGVMDRAFAHSVHRNQPFVGVPELFSALLEELELLPRCARETWLTRLFEAQREVASFPWPNHVASAAGQVSHTPRCIRLLQQTERLGRKLGEAGPEPGHLLLAMLMDPLSAPSRAMDRLGGDRAGLIRELQRELAQRKQRAPALAAAPAANAAHAAAEAAAESHSSGEFRDRADQPNGAANSLLPDLTRDLSSAARRGKLQDTVGRDDETMTMIEILSRQTKNNMILVGEAGVGKTQLVEGLAVRLTKGGGSGFPKLHILELNLPALLSGTQYRGAFEEKLLQLLEDLKRDPGVVLFIDEIHLIMGAGATDGDGMDLANLLKPALSRGEIRCIGATTIGEYRKVIQRDPAIERRFQMLRVAPLSEDATLKVLERLRPSLERHHGVQVSNRAMRASVWLSQRYIGNRQLPDKAIDVLDQACAQYRLNRAYRRRDRDAGRAEKVRPHEVRKVVSQMAGVPIEKLTAEERLQLVDLEERLRREIIGQDEAVAKTVAAVKKSRAGLSDPNRPDAVLLYVGPTGVGKTQLAKLLAQQLFGSRDHLYTFDMTEYVEEHSVSRLLGAPPGYTGYEEEGRLTRVVQDMPFSILLFDEIEKAHPRIYDILMPIFEEGRLRDRRNREVSFRNCIIILTSNVGADVVAGSREEDFRADIMSALREQFRPEFINRLDEIVPFYPLLQEDIREILRLEVNAVRQRLASRRIGIRMYQRAYEYLGEVGYSREFGARELRRAVDRLITTPISAKLLEGAFSDGDMIDVKMEDGELRYHKGPPHGMAAKSS